ncbi:transcription factor of the MADS box [Dipsacomyces acuminosporus]|nr:transcription factor of the MADS box [Dipsacomyces acuminosporus]
MYGYEPKVLAYSDNLSISSSETATHTPSSSSLSSTPIVSNQQAFKMNSAFVPEDPTKINGIYSATDPAGALLDQQHQQHQQQQQQRTPTFSSGTESRTRTPTNKRSRDDEDSDGESENNNKGSGDGTGTEKRAGRRKIKIEYIEDKSRRHITFSKRKAGIMKKAFELSTLTGTQVLLLVVSETGLVYTFTTPKLQPIVTKPEGKNLIQACLNAPDPADAVNQIVQPSHTESNSYMSQPRQSHTTSSTPVYPSSAAALAAATAVAATPTAGGQDPQHLGVDHAFEDRKLQTGSPTTGVNPATASYLQQYYSGQHAAAQAAAAAAAVAAASSGTPSGYATAANSNMAYAAAAVAGYASYPGSNSQSQHHSPITASGTAPPHTPTSGNGISAAVAAAASIPGMHSLANYHHGYSNAPNAAPQSHYQYQHQPQSQHQQHQHQHQTQPQTPTHGMSAPGTPSGSNPSVTAAVAAAVAAAAGNQPSAASYMTATNHYWPQPAAGIASPHPQQPQPQQQPPPAAGLVQRTGYASGS